MIAKVMNRSRPAVSTAIRQLETWGALTIEGDLDARRDYWSGSLEWNEAPVIILADDFRAARQSARLGEVLKVDLTVWPATMQGPRRQAKGISTDGRP